MESTSEVVTKTAPAKSVSVEDGKQVEAQREVVATVTLKNGEKVVEDDTKNGNETVQAEETVIKQETSSTDAEILGEEVEEEEEIEEEEEDDSVEQKVIEKVVDTTDGSEKSTVTTITTVKEQSKPNGTTTTKTVTTTKVSKEAPQIKATTVITTTPPTPTTEEINTLNTETKSEPPAKAEIDEELVEEEVEEDDEEDEQDEVSTVSVQQQLQKDQIPQEATSKQVALKEEAKDATDAPSTPSKTNEPQSHIPTKQDNLNNTIKDIISSIDSNIIAEENIAALKQRELELLKKQQELAMEIKQQQLLAQKLANENQLQQQQQKQQEQQQPQQQQQQQQYHQQQQQLSKTPPETIFSQKTQPITNVSKYSTYEEKQDENNYLRKTETYESRESTNVTKKIDLHKIFTPATDAEEILPKNHYHQYQQQPKPPTSPSILPAYTDAAKHRVQLNMHQEQLLEKYAKPGLKVVKTPWEAALESGSASAAFVEEQKLSPYPTPARSPAPQYFDASQGGLSYEPASVSTIPDSYNKAYSADSYAEYTPQPQHQHKLPQAQYERTQPAVTNPQRELAYKPSLPQGWKAPSMSLPKDLYVPKEIPLQSYAPPPNAAIPPSVSPSMKTSYDNYEPSWKSSNQSQYNYQPPATAAPSSSSFSSPVPTQTTAIPYGGTSSFPLTKPSQVGFSTTYGNNQPPKQQYLPAQSYQTVPQTTTQNVPQVNFNPSPLPYDKLAKFENPSVDSYNNSVYSPPRSSHLNVQGNKVRNTSPAPFGASYQQRPYTPSMESSSFVGTPSISPRPSSALQQHCSGNITPTPQSSYNSNQFLNAPTYNSSARGWRSSGPSAGYQQQRPMAAPMQHIVSAGSMPYTDF